MRTNDYYSPVLIQPYQDGANELFIISGYASATFANEHLERLKELSEGGRDCRVNLIIGMPGKRSDHPGFLRLRDLFRENFNCYYLEDSPPVHSKVYSWMKDGVPVVGYAGSANYSRPGFYSIDQINQISNENPYEIREFFEQLLPRTIPVEEYTGFHVEDVTETGLGSIGGSLAPGQILWEVPDKRVRISFLDRKTGNLPAISGLNWGQRSSKRTDKKTGTIKWDKREPNQAYLSIKKDARKEGFLPPTAVPFTLITDDTHSFDCVVAQEGRKAIHSTYDNSEIGRYIRNRIGVDEGAPVTREQLETYGRTDFVIEKIDDEPVKIFV